MNDSAIRNYAVWARRELMAEVEKRCAWWGVREGADAEADAIDGRVLSAQERGQRRKLLQIAASDGYAQLVERAAYTWFNRLLAIRFMEVNDRLPSHVRVLSGPDGSFEPQCLREALDLPLDALDGAEALRLVQEGDDEALFRCVFLAQCDELARCMPAVFEPVGSAMELLLPTGLLRADGVVGRLVTDIGEDDWREGVEVVGWMYQYYVSERKDEVFAGFKKGRKAERDSIAPATQLFTPHWIVRYLTENSLGRLWMLNHPESSLVDQMPYYVKPDEEHETEFRRISSPEEIAVVDPACGSGHILVYAFELLLQMYRESGYRDRDAVRSILENNLTGLEIDRRAAAMASFALTMKACEADGRFLRRGVTPRVTVLGRVEFTDEELGHLPHLSSRKALLDAAAHLDECGSLLRVSDSDMEAIEGDLASLADGATIFAGNAEAKLARLRSELAPLAARYDVVVANPPYMGGSNMNRWVAGWVKKEYPDSKRDSCTCFIERGFSMLSPQGYSAMVTMESWMFLGSFEKLRKVILEEHSIAALVYMNHMVMRIAFNTCATVFRNEHTSAEGVFTQVYYEDLDENGEPVSFPSRHKSVVSRKTEDLEALADPGCGWFYKRSTDNFSLLPGRPIAYWADDKIISLCSNNPPLMNEVSFKEGITTGNNEKYLRLWHEPSFSHLALSIAEKPHGRYWIPCNKGGGYRKWYGNNDYVIDWTDDGMALSLFPGSSFRNAEFQRKKGVSYSNLTSGTFSARLSPEGFAFESKGTAAFSTNSLLTLAYLNTSLFGYLAKLVCPTLDYKFGILQRLPNLITPHSEKCATKCVQLAHENYDSFETSWEFMRHPMI